MTRKTTSPRKRMREVLHKGSKGLAPTHLPLGPEISPEQLWAIEARSALTIVDIKEARLADGTVVPTPADWIDYSARAVRRLFDHFKLDPEQPHNWRYLINLFAYAEFWEGPKRKAGAPKRADDDLAAALASLPGHSNAEAARKLARKFAKGTSTSGLRRRIAKVRAEPEAGK